MIGTIDGLKKDMHLGQREGDEKIHGKGSLIIHGTAGKIYMAKRILYIIVNTPKWKDHNVPIKYCSNFVIFGEHVMHYTIFGQIEHTKPLPIP